MKNSLGIPMTAEQYADEWDENSKFFESHGYYKWMASFLGEISTVLEIGCGSGRSTAMIAESTQKVICIEINPKLAAKTESYLTSKGISSKLLNMDDLHGTLPINVPKVIIVVADIFDERLVNILSGSGIDAITNWLTGANPGLIGAKLSIALENFTGPEMIQYREQIHRRTYELGTVLLKGGGIVQITDRMNLISWNEKDWGRTELVKQHTNLSNGKFKITKENTLLARIEKPMQTSNIQYIVPEEVKSKGGILVLSSVKSVKL